MLNDKNKNNVCIISQIANNCIIWQIFAKFGEPIALLFPIVFYILQIKDSQLLSQNKYGIKTFLNTLTLYKCISADWLANLKNSLINSPEV